MKKIYILKISSEIYFREIKLFTSRGEGVLVIKVSKDCNVFRKFNELN